MTAFRHKPVFTSAPRIGMLVAIVSGVILFAGCRHDAVRGDGVARAAVADLAPLSASAGVGGGAVNVDLSASSIVLPDYVAVRRYQDVFTIDGNNRRVFVEYGWDYRRGIVVETIYEADGTVSSRTDKPAHTLNFTDRELELAIALAREDERLRDVLAEQGLHYYAGFPYRQAEQPMCAMHSRCVHVIVSADDGQRHVAHAIVDLMTRKVVLPKLDDWRTPDPVPNDKKS